MYEKINGEFEIKKKGQLFFSFRVLCIFVTYDTPERENYNT